MPRATDGQKSQKTVWVCSGRHCHFSRTAWLHVEWLINSRVLSQLGVCCREERHMNPHRLYFVWGIRVKLGMSSKSVQYLLPTPEGDLGKGKKNAQANTWLWPLRSRSWHRSYLPLTPISLRPSALLKSRCILCKTQIIFKLERALKRPMYSQIKYSLKTCFF